MRILLVTAHFRPHVGGIERFTETLAEELSARGHDVTVLCCRTDRSTPLAEEGAYRVVRVPSSTQLELKLSVPYPLPAPRALVRAVRREVARADVVHVQDALYATSVAALRRARRAGTPSLLTQHVGFVPQGRPLLDALQQLAVATVGRAARLATRVVALNDEVARWAATRWGLEAVEVAPVGVRAAAAVDRATIRARLGLPADRFLALFVGRDVPKKGLDVVLAAGSPAYDLVAVTDRDGPVPDGARLVPFLPHDELLQVYGAVDAFVLPSVAEGIPVSLQEAMAAGLPVVCVDDPGYRSVFGADDAALVDRTPEGVREALERLAADPTFRGHLGERSRVVAEGSFGLARFVDRYEQLYEQLQALPERY